MSPILMVAVAVGGWLGAGSDQWVVYDGSEGPGRGKHIVLISGVANALSTFENELVVSMGGEEKLIYEGVVEEN